MLTKDLFKKPKNDLEHGEGALPGTGATGEEPCVACPRCHKVLFVRDLEDSLYVCGHCSHHFRIGPRWRLTKLLDEGSFEEFDRELRSFNRIGFPGYEKKLEKAQENSGEEEGVLTGRGRIGGFPCALFAMNPDFMMGSMGSVVGEKITRLFEYALGERLPVVGFTVSGGARMQEGIFSLMQMAKTSGAVRRHSDAGLLYAAVLTDPTSGGVTASFAMEADVILAEPRALICFAGPRVIEQTIRQSLPEGFQQAEFLLHRGFLDGIVDRREQRAYLHTLLFLHGKEGTL